MVAALGSGPIGVREGLEQFLPNPRVTCEFDEDGMVDYKIEMGEESLGCISGFLGNFGVMMRALAYIVTLGSDNLKWVCHWQLSMPTTSRNR